MTAPFVPFAQRHENLPAKLVAVLERIARVVYGCLWQVFGEIGLSALQLTLLERLAAKPLGVRDLAETLQVTRATVSRALKTLEEKALVVIKTHPHDRRQVEVTLTPAGRELGRESQAWANPLLAALESLPKAERAMLWLSLLKLLRHFERSGLMAANHMCLSCRFLRKKGEKLYCTLLEQDLIKEQLRIHCPDYQPEESFKETTSNPAAN